MQPLTTPRAARPKADPAPSRLVYRMQRLWLTPLVRAVAQLGLPLFALAFTLGYFGRSPAVIATIETRYTEIARAIADRPEFLIHDLQIDGASPALVAEIRVLLDLDLPVSRFDLDLVALQGQIADLPAVAAAQVSTRPGRVLGITVEERVPAIIWQTAGGDAVLDASGNRVADLDTDLLAELPDAIRASLPDLPIVTGPGADMAVPEALALLDAATPIAPRIRGLVRQGERRWDIILRDGPRLLLPEQGAAQALDRILAAHAAEDLLDRAVAAVDFRSPDRPTLRLTAPAMDKLRAIRSRAAHPVGDLD